jgi:hypothetical protein
MKIFETYEKGKRYDYLKRQNDNLLERCRILQTKSDEQVVFLQSFKNISQQLEDEKRKRKDLEQKLNNLTNKEEKEYNKIDKPELSLKEIETAMKLSDKFTLNQIVHYLKLDSFELVKKIA